ncbi:MAG: hypothetical protein FPO08_00630 [Geobacter sp.]|nr:MAG: hypothetical protein FPO08_00630 [Geobacter sp.]
MGIRLLKKGEYVRKILKAMVYLILSLQLFGCTSVTIGERRHDLDLAATAKDQELTIKQNTTQIFPDEKQRAIQEQNNLRYKWWINTGPDAGAVTAPVQQDEDKVKAFNKTLNKQLYQQQSQ